MTKGSNDYSKDGRSNAGMDPKMNRNRLKLLNRVTQDRRNPTRYTTDRSNSSTTEPESRDTDPIVPVAGTSQHTPKYIHPREVPTGTDLSDLKPFRVCMYHKCKISKCQFVRSGSTRYSIWLVKFRAGNVANMKNSGFFERFRTKLGRAQRVEYSVENTSSTPGVKHTNKTVGWKPLKPGKSIGGEYLELLLITQNPSTPVATIKVKTWRLRSLTAQYIDRGSRLTRIRCYSLIIIRFPSTLDSVRKRWIR